MASIQNKIDFAVIFTVDAANPNGDPLNGNRPRTTINGFGEVSDVCIKRKIRNRLQDIGEKIFVQSQDRADDGAKSLRERATPLLDKFKGEKDNFATAACKEWFDVRAFGQLFALSEKGKGKGKGKKKEEESNEEGSDAVSIGIRGPVSIRPAFSVSPINITSVQITKSVNSETEERKGSDTMGMKYRIDHGVYVLFGSISPQLAKKTGFSDSDAEILKKTLCTLFENDSSSARPDGSMDIVQVYWWNHNCPSGQYSSAKVHSSLQVVSKIDNPRCVEDYNIILTDLEKLTPEIY